MAANITILVTGYVFEEHVGSTVSLVQDGNVRLVIDPGMVEDRDDIVRSLAREKLAVEDITHVFITHHHPDHTINVGMFGNAMVVDYDSIYQHNVWLSHEGNYHITANIHVTPTPGHTMEDATLFVKTNEGVVAFTHAWWHETLTPKEDPLAQDQEKLEESRRYILETADFIVPSHGSLKKLKKD